MVVNFSQFDCGEKPILVLKNLDGTAIQTLGYAFGIEADFSYNEVSTLTFNVPAQVDGREVPGYADVVGMRIIDLVGYGEFLLVNPEVESDGIKEIKTCKAYSLEHEFSKKMIFLEAGTFNFCDGIDYSNPNTIIGRIKECMPDWTFDISESLVGKYRTFDDINKNVYEFMKSDVQKKYQCIFDFNTYERLVIVHDVNKDAPTNQVYLSEDNLIHKIEIGEDSDNIVTRLDVNGAEGISIRSVNPTGTNKIYNLDYFMTTKNFSQEFIDTWRKWEEDCAAKQTLYYDITMSYNMKLLAILTKEAEIADLEAELVSKENILGAKIQLIAQSTDDKTKKEQQEALDDVNAEISNIKSNIASLKSVVEEMKANVAEVNTRRENINKELAFENYFTDKNDLAVLRRYFIDDVLQDSSFVAETAATYIEQDYSIILNNSSVSISEASNVIETVDASGNRVISFSGGTLTMNSLTAKMIRGTLYFETSGDVVFSGYAENGTVGEASFLNGSITVSGTHSSLSVSNSSLVFAISNGRLYFTEKCSEYKQHQIEWELYEYGHQTLKERASPTYNFKVECSNFLTIDDYLLFQRQFSLGQKVYLYLDGKILEPYVISVHVNFDDPTDFSIEFSSYYTSFDQSFNLAKLLDESVATGKTLSYKSGMYSAFVNSGASTAVKDFMGSALDISKNAVLSSENQAISFDDTGIRIRKWADGSKTDYEPEEIWMIDNVIAFTDDNWRTSKMAIGKIFDPNFVTSDNPEGLKYGIAAPYIVGTLLAGENLVIDTENGAFKVDSSGVYIDALNFHIRRENANGSEMYDKTIGDILSETGDVNADAGSLSGIINSQKVQMQSATGNVLFDGDGLWLMNTTNKESMTTAIWMNEKGISFGTGNAGKYDIDENDGGWKWTTAIGHDGIAASAIAAGTLSGMKIVGGELNIGPIKNSAGEVTGYNFVVDTNGNVTANSGTFTGTIKAEDILFNDGKNYKSILNTSNQIEHNYLNLKGLTITNEDGDETFVISPDGNVTVNGDITLGSGSKISWGNVTGKPEFSDVATSGSYDDLDDQPDIPVLPDYLHSTYISETQIYSPEIYANEFTVTPNSNAISGGFYLKGHYYEIDGEKVTGDMFNITYANPGEWGVLSTVEIEAPSAVYVNWKVAMTKFENAILDFDGAEVRNFPGGTTTAVFG